ncbi:MAG: class II fructose-bisphosphate aldolase [Anaerolineae bacterium]|nr:class II fructose-bisphosphate aldolase [Anaerolineae bacterium]
MPIVALKEMLDDALNRRYGVGAFNIVNDLTLKAVLEAAEEQRSPVIIQTSIKTVKTTGVDVLFAMWSEMAKKVSVPVCLHLDHCPDRNLISACLAKGWGSVLFDASSLSLDENRRQTIEVVAEARRYGAAVEGEIDSIKTVDEVAASSQATHHHSVEVSLAFIHDTQIDCFAPAIGNAHGVYKETPTLDVQLVSDIVSAHPIPIALHGGTGLTDDQFKDLIGRGCAKVNISTAVKMSYMQSNLAFLKQAESADRWDPLALFKQVEKDVKVMAANYMQVFGSAGRA